MNGTAANGATMQTLQGQLPFLQKLARADVAYILHDAVEEQSFSAGQFLYAQDESVKYVRLILEGSVEEVRTTRQTSGARNQTLRRIVGPGTKLGIYDFLAQHEHSTRARARESGRLIAIRATALERLLYRFPETRSSLAPLQKIERLRTIPLLADLDWIALGFVADATSDKIAIKAQQAIYSAGNPAEQIYFIDQGQVELRWLGGDALLQGNGATFGFSAPGATMPGMAPPLDHDATATINTTLFVIGRQNLIDIMGLPPEEPGHRLRRLMLGMLDQLPVFHNFTPAQRQLLAGFVSYYHIPNNYLLIQQGELNDSLWMLLPGSYAKIHALDKDGAALLSTNADGPNYFGEHTLITQLPANSTIEAEAGSHWLRLHARDFQVFAREYGPDLPQKLILRASIAQLRGTVQQREQYSWLQEDEVLQIFLRHHWLILFRKTLLAQILLLVLIVSLLVISRVTEPAYIWFFFSLGALIALFALAWGIIDYLNDYIMVTNRRVVRQEKVLFFSEWRQEAPIDQVQNVTTSQTFFGNLLGYGRVDVQTAAVRNPIRFDYVPDPNTVKTAIFAQRDTRAGHVRAEGKLIIQHLLAGRLGVDLQLPARVRIDAPERSAPTKPSWWQNFVDALLGRLHLQRTLQDRIIWRKHWVVLFVQIVGPLFILLAILTLLLSQLTPIPGLEQYRQLLQTLDIVLVICGLADLIWLAWLVEDWRNDTYEVTKTEIIDVEKTPLFLSEVRRSARLNDIQNVTVEIPTPFHYWLNYGNVQMETAGKEGILTFSKVPGPREVAAEINRRIDAFRRNEELNAARKRAQELPDWFEMYNRLDPDKQEWVRAAVNNPLKPSSP